MTIIIKFKLKTLESLIEVFYFSWVEIFLNIFISKLKGFAFYRERVTLTAQQDTPQK